MGRRLFMGVALMVFVLACNLGSATSVQPTTRPAQTPTQVIPTLAVPQSTNDTSFSSRCPPPEQQTSGKDFVLVTPALGFDGQCYLVQANTTVTISWPGVPKDAISVEFYYHRANSTTKADTIGVDTNLADGASVTWQTYPQIYGFLFALANLPVKSRPSDAVNLIAQP